MRVLQRLIRPGDLFVDVGANIGIYTIFVADLGGEVLALEPVHTDHLEENLSLNGYDVTIVEKAASNLVGELRFSLDRDQENSILLDGAADEAAMVVPATTVDTELGDRHARVVKIDVEGFERLVVEGMERCLSERRVDAVQLEWNRASEDALSEDRHPVAAALIEHGYRLTLPDNSGALAPCSGAYNADESIDIFALSPALAGSVLGPE